MSDGHKPQLFLLGQRLLRLCDDVPLSQRRFYVCGDGPPPSERMEEPWTAVDRLPLKDRNADELSLVERALSDAPWKYVALACEAGLGKTTNMRWLRTRLSQRGSRVVPLLLELHTTDLGLLVKEHADSNALLDHLAHEVARAVKDDNIERHKHYLRKLREQGRITFLIDGLDHGLSRTSEPLPQILAKMMETSWANCPMWISGRPNALNRAWPLFADSRWTFLRVEGLHVPEICFYLREQVEPDEKERTSNDWYTALPEDGRELLAIPRFLHLVAGVLQQEVASAKQSGMDTLSAIAKLDLHTRADVYRLAYFSRGEEVAPKHLIAGKDDGRDRRGLIAQSLDACYRFDEDGTWQYLGLKKGEPADDTKLARRIRFTAGLLGAIAFEMYANPDNYGPKKRNDEPVPLQPNTTGITETYLGLFEDAVRDRLLAASPLFKAEIIENAFLILGANNRTVDYLMFNELDEKMLAWHDPTVQAFFAAYWAMNYATPQELKAMDRWKVVLGKDSDDDAILLTSFDEFWQFAAEMPDHLLHDPRRENWLTTFAPCYTPPQELPDDDDMVQWHRRMIYHSFLRMEQRSAYTIKTWRALWLKLKDRQGRPDQQAIFETIKFCRCPRDPLLDGKPFVMGSPESEAERYEDEVQRAVLVKAFAMQDFPVTNAQYELFDPKHRAERDEYSGREEQPVTWVTFWDAWNFARWTGNQLPTEAEWEYACRAGTTTRYHFGDEIDASICNYHANVGRMTAQGEKNYPVNAWGLFDMHGNVSEWCDSRYESGILDRVLRGGGWDDDGARCRSANRNGIVPGWRDRSCGFRLTAVPCGVGAKESKSAGAGAASVVES